jgi:hypothetical protein
MQRKDGECNVDQKVERTSTQVEAKAKTMHISMLQNQRF